MDSQAASKKPANDEELEKFLHGVTIASVDVLPNINTVLLPKGADGSSSQTEKDSPAEKSPKKAA
ncbi:unnamed protein product [Eruca vesicaria subsp. sativa]|uniref:Histone H2A C-terminal domain-containing protein n=1 Tax=Eruca vesicaria subsp. sativa TaxID=29727 RepID=A0ABC8IUB7_ERUVS|nr:unnamed protein product [Eruca vesicaria subsp. sativa]